jgi:hypothetical protein
MDDYSVELYHIDIYSEVPGMPLNERVASRFSTKTKKLLTSYPFDRSSHTMTKYKMKLRIFEQYSALCKNTIDRNYLNHAINNANILFVMYQLSPVLRFQRKEGKSTATTSQKESIQGFIVGQVQEDGKVLYLDVICARNGSVLIQTLIDFCKYHRMDYIKLHSLTSVLGYYPQFGFAHKKTCDASKPVDVQISKDLVDHIRQAPLLEDSKTAYNDDVISTFLMKLHEKGYTARTTDACRKAATKATFRAGDCASDGFEMRLCLRDIPDIPSIEDEPIAASAAPKLLTPRYLKSLVAQTRKKKGTKKGTKKGAKKGTKKGAKKGTKKDFDPYLEKLGNKLIKQKQLKKSYKNFRRTRKLTQDQRRSFQSAFKSVGMNINSDSD